MKIGDFGHSVKTNSYDQVLKCKIGTLTYAAPEVFSNTAKYTCAPVDIWSSGVVLYVMATGSLPFDCDDRKELVQNILNVKYEKEIDENENYIICPNHISTIDIPCTN